MYRNSEFTLEYYPMLLIRIGSIAVCEWGLKASETIQLKVKLFTIQRNRDDGGLLPDAYLHLINR